MKKIIFLLLICLSSSLCFASDWPSGGREGQTIKKTTTGRTWSNSNEWNSSQSTSITTAITDAVAKGYGVLLIDEDTTITAETTIPSTLSVKTLPGATVTFGVYDLTINGPFEGSDGCFNVNSTGRVTFPALKEYQLDWFYGFATDDATVDASVFLGYLIAGMPANGGKIVLLEGKHYWETKCVINRDTFYLTIEGQGQGYYDDNNATEIVLDADLDYMLDYGDGTNQYIKSPVIKNITFVNPDAHTLSGAAIRFRNVRTPVVDGCGFTNYDSAMTAWKTYGGKVEKCGFSDCGNLAGTLNTLYIYGTGADVSTAWTVRDNIFESGKYREISMQCTDYWIQNNYFESGANNLDLMVYTSGVGEITDNVFYDANDYTSAFIYSATTYDRISNNFFNGGVTAVKIYGPNGFIDSNEFHNQTQYGIQCSQTDAAVVNAYQIHDNIIEGTGDTGYAGIYVGGTQSKGIKIHDNHIYNRKQYGIQIANGSYIEAYNNTIANYSGSDLTIGIYESGASLTGNKILPNNTIIGVATEYSLKNAQSWLKEVRTGLYDFGVSGGVAGSFTLGNIPDNATITRAWYEVITPFTSGGAATVALGVVSDDASGILTATAYGDAAYNAGYHDATPDGTATNFTTISTAQRNVVLTVAAADLTAGKIRLWYEYITSE